MGKVKVTVFLKIPQHTAKMKRREKVFQVEI